jgi:hypothetical protein
MSRVNRNMSRLGAKMAPVRGGARGIDAALAAAMAGSCVATRLRGAPTGGSLRGMLGPSRTPPTPV